MQSKIKHKKGDATEPKEKGKVMLAHCVNDLGFGGAGVIVPIKNKYPIAYEEYVKWFKNGYFINNDLERIKAQLGEIQPVRINENFYICNIVGQRGVGKFRGMIPFRYQSFQEAMYKLDDYMVDNNFDVLVLPRIGCGLAGADYLFVSAIINKTITIPVVVYDLPNENWPDTIYEEENESN
jgi:O-acetyl-ADP-ribose deacetylase (regulator of RNase III)